MRRALAFLCLFALPATGQGGDPAAAVAAFYGVYQAQPHGGVPDATVRLRYAAVLSPRLNKLLADASAAQAKLAARVKSGGPKAAVMPVLEGDVFTSLFEGATGWKLGQCSGDAHTQRCSVALSHVAGKDKPTNWSDTLVMTASAGGWKLDDVVYDPNFAFGNTGQLSDMLRMVVAQNS